MGWRAKASVRLGRESGASPSAQSMRLLFSLGRFTCPHRRGGPPCPPATLSHWEREGVRAYLPAPVGAIRESPLHPCHNLPSAAPPVILSREGRRRDALPPVILSREGGRTPRSLLTTRAVFGFLDRMYLAWTETVMV